MAFKNCKNVVKLMKTIQKVIIGSCYYTILDAYFINSCRVFKIVV